MKSILCLVACLIVVVAAHGQANVHPQPHPGAQAAPAGTPSERDSSDLELMRADIQRLRVLLNQMRNNLAFVDSSQSPLKHEFELQADAWQIVVDQMDRRLKRMEESRPAAH